MDEEWDDELLSKIDDLESLHLQSIAAKVATEKRTNEPATAVIGTWACKSCTLQNDQSRVTCLVCKTPKGQIFEAAMATHSLSAAASQSSLHVKKTVQSTLQFVSPATQKLAFQQQPQHQNVAPSYQPTSVSTTTLATASSANTYRQQFPVRNNRSRHRAMNTTTVPAPASAWPIAATQRQRSGEDEQAKTRYLEIVDHSNFPEIDREAAQHFVYPTNYPIREYQLTISEKALYHNTLVSLPTGLGKTLIASVVMYNFYRWFPQGKIVFMAPTKPLVAQQVRACHEIMAIPLSNTAELQGNVPPGIRKVLWNTKRVFFCTPQSMQNDLRQGVCKAEHFVCVVVDEAHRATGNYAYCCVIQEIEKKTKFFRVLALSATPGSKFDIIQDVVKNLRISHIESRSADDDDVKKYTHARQEEVIKCSLSSQITEIKSLFLKVFRRIVHRLFSGNIIQYRDPDKLSRWYVLQARERFRQSSTYSSNRSAESDLALLVSLLHARDLLTVHGVSSFKDYVDQWVEERERGERLSWSKKEMLQSSEFHALVLGLNAVGRGGGSSSHPKLMKLREILHEHFQRHAQGKSSTRAIVFTQYRASVTEIVNALNEIAPLLKVQPFVGQGASGKSKESKGQSQKLQQEIVKKFRAGEFNVLVATCIAEEGLDIGEVDLIVSFDALTSPVRMIQRMGRTGRKRVGKVIILVTEGDEEKKLARSVASAKTVSRALTTFKSKFVFAKCPRMIPVGIYPKLSKLEMQIPEFHSSQVAGKQTDSSGSSRHQSVLMGEDGPNGWKLSEIEKSIAKTKYFPFGFASSERNTIFPVATKRAHLIRTRRTNWGTFLVGHSKRSIALRALVRKANDVIDLNGDASDDDDAITADESERNEGHMSPLALKRKERIASTPMDVDANGIHVTRSKQFSIVNDVGKNEGDVGDDNEIMDNCSMHFSPHFTEPVPEKPAADDVQVKQSKKKAECHPTFKPKSSATKVKDPLSQSSPAVTTCLSPVVDVTKDKSKTSKQARIAQSEIERGEKLLKNLEELATLSVSLAPAVSSPSSEIKTKLLPAGSEREERRKVGLVRPVFPKLSITRRLEFDEVENDDKPIPSKENCVPEPPLLTLASIQTTPADPQPSLPQDLVYFASDMLTASADHVDGAETARKTKRSLSLRKSNELGEANNDTEVTFLPSDVNEIDLTIQMETADAIDLCKTNDATAEKALELPKTYNARSDINVSIIDMTKSPQRPQETVVEDKPDDSECCSVCRIAESYDDDPIVFCDGCNVPVHQFCYGIKEVPIGKWFCDFCASPQETKCIKCHLCPIRGGAVKRTFCGHWVHIQCFIWIPELRLQPHGDVLALGSLKTLDPDRRTLQCSICHSQKGFGIIQCAHKRCLVAFHVSCAAHAQFKMVQEKQLEEDDETTLFLVYCSLHRNSKALREITQEQLNELQQKAKCQPMVQQIANDSNKCNISSPSALLLSPADPDSDKKFRKFRRLKRKYDASQSTPKGRSASSGPRSLWGKRIKRSEQYAEGRKKQARAIAKMFIEDDVEVRGDDDNDDEYDDDDLEDDDQEDSFINDSSQLIYSPLTPNGREGTPTVSKSRKYSSPGDMRAIYAQSLLESQNTPIFLRRGRTLGAIPADGVLNSCLQRLKEPTASLPTQEHSISPGALSASDGCIASSSPCVDSSLVAVETTERTTVCDASEREVVNVSNLHVATVSAGPGYCGVMRAEDDDFEAPEPDPPSFNLLSNVQIQLPNNKNSSATNRSDAQVIETIGDNVDCENEQQLIQKRIEENRLKALQKLRERQQARVLEVQRSASMAMHAAKPSVQPPAVTLEKEDSGATNATAVIPSFSLLSSTSTFQSKKSQLIDLTDSRNEAAAQGPNARIIVSPSFSQSTMFRQLVSTKYVSVSVDIVNSLEADLLLSARVGVIWLLFREFCQLEQEALGGDVQQHPRIRPVMGIFKKLLVIIQLENPHQYSRELQQMMRSTIVEVIVQSSTDTICEQLQRIAIQEKDQGYSLPSLFPIAATTTAIPAEDVDPAFPSRLAFFLSIPVLSYGSALSLSFRFHNFSVAQVPIKKFNEMHWRRMLPWLSEESAKQIHAYIISTNF